MMRKYFAPLFLALSLALAVPGFSGEVTGSVSIVNGSAATSGSTAITVPADATAVVLFYNFWESGGDAGAQSFSIDGDPFVLGDFTTTAGEAPAAGVYTLVNPSTGSQNLAWNWTAGNARTGGGGIYLVYVKGVDTADLVRDADTAGALTTGSVSLTLDSTSTDLVLAMGASYNANPEITSAASSLADNSTINSHRTDVDVMTAGASTTSVVVTGLAYSGSAAISLKNDEGGGPSSVAPQRRRHTKGL